MHWAPGIPHALILFRGGKFLHNSGASRRGNVIGCLKLETKIHHCRPGQAKRDPGPITTALSCCVKVIEQRLSRGRHGVWVPAFAGTTPVSLRGAISATKRSIFDLVMPSHGLLRGAGHRARIRAARWLAMTLPTAGWLEPLSPPYLAYLSGFYRKCLAAAARYGIPPAPLWIATRDRPQRP